MEGRTNVHLKKLSFLLLLAGLWGPSFLFIRLAVHDVPPFTLVAGRMLAAAGLLYLLLRLRGGRLPRERKVWAHFAFLALIGTALPFLLVSWGEQYVDSALASILNATVPIFTLILAHFWTKDDRLTGLKILGVGLGMLGALFLIAPSIDEGMQMGTLGLVAVTLACLGYGIAGVYARKYIRGLPPLVAPTMQFIISAIYILPFSLAVDRPWSLENPSATAWMAWGGLILFGTVIAFAVYYHLLELATASYISMVTYLIPIIAVVLGVVVANEQLGWNAYAGCAAILLGVFAVNGLPRRRRSATP